MTSLRVLARRAKRLPVLAKVAVGVVVGALVLLPLASIALRSSSFAASVEVFPLARPVFGRPRDPVAYVRRLLRDPNVAVDVQQTVDMRIDRGGVAHHVRITPKGDHTLVTARADTPEHARILVDAVVSQLANASVSDLVSFARAGLNATRAQLAAAPAPADRAVLLRRARRLTAVLAKPPFALVAGPRPPRPRPGHVVDRIVDALPGPFPARPGALETALIGVALALGLSLVIAWRFGTSESD